MKAFLILLLILSNLFSIELEKLNSLKQIKDKQEALIMFSTSYCPWCARQRTHLEQAAISLDEIQIFEIKDEDKFYQKLIKKYPFTIRFFPTTFIVEREGEELFIKYEFQGFQDRKKILEVLKDEDRF